jgi:hypothetical protein
MMGTDHYRPQLTKIWSLFSSVTYPILKVLKIRQQFPKESTEHYKRIRKLVGQIAVVYELSTLLLKTAKKQVFFALFRNRLHTD